MWKRVLVNVIHDSIVPWARQEMNPWQNSNVQNPKNTKTEVRRFRRLTQILQTPMNRSHNPFNLLFLSFLFDELVKSPSPSLRGAKRRGNPTCNASRPEAAVGGSKDLSLSRGDPSLLSGQCFALDCRASLAMTNRRVSDFLRPRQFWHVLNCQKTTLNF
jgi:hypothetical protein